MRIAILSDTHGLLRPQVVPPGDHHGDGTGAAGRDTQ